MAVSEQYEEQSLASPRKRGRGLGLATIALRESLVDILAEQEMAVTVRQAFYLAVVRKAVEKTEAGYGRVQRQLVQMRRQGLISHEAIADGTRWMRKPRSYSGLESMLAEQERMFRRDLWQDQDAYVEVWCEKDALAGVVLQATQPWDCPLMVSRGFSSESFLYSAGQAIQSQDRPSFVYLLSDFDRAGMQLADAIEDGLHRLSGGADLTFQRVALTQAQVGEWGIETRPPKQRDLANGWRHMFSDGCAELDAIPPRSLVSLVDGCIEQHINQGALAQHKLLEQEQRESLRSFTRSWRAGRPVD